MASIGVPDSGWPVPPAPTFSTLTFSIQRNGIPSANRTQRVVLQPERARPSRTSARADLNRLEIIRHYCSRSTGFPASPAVRFVDRSFAPGPSHGSGKYRKIRRRNCFPMESETLKTQKKKHPVSTANLLSLGTFSLFCFTTKYTCHSRSKTMVRKMARKSTKSGKRFQRLGKS
ncbi:unnamed protein product [Nesidiocoris tenuis]|uniref:Uncharacterized protein n=1 Tax=Nesidiocoris tenuis TaxID=355587 RepID=A0A6H5GPW6_9HEMI|nr:unnamed protein product [Nesidiocoris tenuis]